MKELKELQLELLDKISYQRERYGIVDSELLYQYDRLTDYINRKESKND